MHLYPNSSEPGKQIWESGGNTSPIEKITNTTNIEYHLAQAKIKRTNITLLERTLKNDTGNTIEYLIEYDKNLTIAHRWTRKDDVKTAFTSTYKTGIPKVLDDGRIDIVGHYDYMEDITFTEGLRLKDTVKVPVKPHTEVHVTMIIRHQTQSSIHI